MKITEAVVEGTVDSVSRCKRLLFVDDDPVILEGYRFIFEDEGFKVDIALDENTLMRLIEKNEYETIILDYNIGEKKGAEIAKQIRKICDAEIIFISGQNSAEEELKRNGIRYNGFFLKPLKAEQLLEFITGG